MTTPHPPAGGAVRRPGFLAGLAGPLQGARLVGEHPRLWLWIVVPLLINAATFGALVLVGWNVAQSMQDNLASASWGWIDGVRTFLAPVLGVLLTVVSILAALLVTLLVSSIINAPFYDLLSEQVQRVALLRRRRGSGDAGGGTSGAGGGGTDALPDGLDDSARPWSLVFADTVFALRAALSLALMQAAILCFLFLLSFTAVGAPIFVVAGFFFTGFGLADITLARWRLDAPARRLWAWRHAPLLLGLGLPVSLLPPLAPFGVVGATLLCLQAARRASGRERTP